MSYATIEAAMARVEQVRAGMPANGFSHAKWTYTDDGRIIVLARGARDHTEWTEV
jgi:hypothetical protein